MSFPNRDAQILAHILEYCNRIEKTLSRFGREFDVFLDDQDYMDSVSMNLLQIGELAGKFSYAYVQKTKPQMDWRAIKKEPPGKTGGSSYAGIALCSSRDASNA